MRDVITRGPGSIHQCEYPAEFYSIMSTLQTEYTPRIAALPGVWRFITFMQEVSQGKYMEVTGTGALVRAHLTQLYRDLTAYFTQEVRSAKNIAAAIPALYFATTSVLERKVAHLLYASRALPSEMDLLSELANALQSKLAGIQSARSFYNHMQFHPNQLLHTILQSLLVDVQRYASVGTSTVTSCAQIK